MLWAMYVTDRNIVDAKVAKGVRRVLVRRFLVDIGAALTEANRTWLGISGKVSVWFGDVIKGALSSMLKSFRVARTCMAAKATEYRYVAEF